MNTQITCYSHAEELVITLLMIPGFEKKKHLQATWVEIRKWKLSGHTMSLFSYEEFLPDCLFVCL